VSVVVFSFVDDEAANCAAAQLFIRFSLPPADVSLGTHARMGSVHDGLPLLAACVTTGALDAVRRRGRDVRGNPGDRARGSHVLRGDGRLTPTKNRPMASSPTNSGEP